MAPSTGLGIDLSLNTLVYLPWPVISVRPDPTCHRTAAANTTAAITTAAITAAAIMTAAN